MRGRLLLLAAAALLAACRGPRPCAKALCPVSSTGLYEVWGVTSVSAPADAPLPAVPPDASVGVRSGRAEFRVADARVVAEQGATFRFFLSSGMPALDVSSGPVSVSLSSGAPLSAASGFILLQ